MWLINQCLSSTRFYGEGGLNWVFSFPGLVLCLCREDPGALRCRIEPIRHAGAGLPDDPSEHDPGGGHTDSEGPPRGHPQPRLPEAAQWAGRHPPRQPQNLRRQGRWSGARVYGLHRILKTVSLFLSLSLSLSSSARWVFWHVCWCMVQMYCQSDIVSHLDQALFLITYCGSTNGHPVDGEGLPITAERIEGIKITQPNK